MSRKHSSDIGTFLISPTKVSFRFRIDVDIWKRASNLSIDKKRNLARKVIDGFGHEWSVFNYFSDKSESELNKQFDAYFNIVNLSEYNFEGSTAADFGAGSGRWSYRLIDFFSKIYVLEPSSGAVKILEAKFGRNSKFVILQQTVDSNDIPNESLDFAFSLGVLHHIPDTKSALKQISEKLKPGGRFLCYLYYKLDDKPFHYKFIFKISNLLRFIIARLPFALKRALTFIIAVFVYLPLSRISKLLHKFGFAVSNLPLHHYADLTFEMMANDSLDRFGTRLEQRFNKNEIIEMLRSANFDLDSLIFSEQEPFWTFTVNKR